MMNKQKRDWIDDILEALTHLGGEASLPAIYEEVGKLRTHKTKCWTQSAAKTIHEYCSDSKFFKGEPGSERDLIYKKGKGRSVVYGLRKLPLSDPLKPAPRKQVLVNRIIRDNELGQRIKSQHADCCQICGETFRLDNNRTYSEGHHLQPLGKPHEGYDIEENLIVVCPSCHVRCDYAAIPIEWKNIKNRSKHGMSEKYVKYHNARFRGEKLQKPETFELVDRAE